MSFQSPWLLLGLALLPLLGFAYLAAEKRPRRAAAALIGALARPQVSIAVPAEQAAIVLAMDHSGSMQATDVAPSRLTAALDAGEGFLKKVPAKVKVGGVVFGSTAEAVQSPTTDREALA